MSSVTQKVKEIQQPRGGFLPVKKFKKIELYDEYILNNEENIHASLVGLVVDYMARFLSGDTIDKAFSISIRGASMIGMKDKADSLKTNIVGMDDTSIISACKLVGFDVCFRYSIAHYKPIEEISPNQDTINNIRIMIKRSLVFLGEYGPITHSAPTFDGGYTKTITCGDADFTTTDTLWDFKVLKSPPNSKQTLQLLIYYIMGLHSKYKFYAKITKLGFYNPRLNTLYICHTSEISKEIIEEIETKVICYNDGESTNVQNNVALEKNETPKEVFCNNKTETTFYVSDVFKATKRKKHLIYNDIHIGKLKATKKHNTYIISESEYYRYIKNIKIQNIVLISLYSIFAVILFVFIFKFH